MNREYWKETLLLEKLIENSDDNENFIHLRSRINDILSLTGMIREGDTAEHKIGIVENITATLILSIIDMRRELAREHTKII